MPQVAVPKRAQRQREARGAQSATEARRRIVGCPAGREKRAAADISPSISKRAGIFLDKIGTNAQVRSPTARLSQCVPAWVVTTSVPCWSDWSRMHLGGLLAFRCQNVAGLGFPGLRAIHGARRSLLLQRLWACCHLGPTSLPIVGWGISCSTFSSATLQAHREGCQEAWKCPADERRRCCGDTEAEHWPPIDRLSRPRHGPWACQSFNVDARAMTRYPWRERRQ